MTLPLFHLIHNISSDYMSFMYMFLFTLDSLPEINEMNLIYKMIRFGDADIIPVDYNTKLYSGHGRNSVKSKHISMLCQT